MLDIIDYAKTNFDLNISAKQLNAFKTYENELIDWNKRFNLTAINDREMIHIKHFLDSITCITLMRNSTMERVIDVGSGGGFPGLPIKIIFPSIKLTLVESVGKKADFCSHIVKLLALKEVRVINQRAEDIGRNAEFREKYDWAIARAVAILPVLAEYLLPFVKIGGNMLAMKGLNAAIEAQDAEKSFRILGGKLRKLQAITLPKVTDERYLIVVEKYAATPLEYPRRAGIPAKNPL